MGEIPTNLRLEIAADIHLTSRNSRPFSESYLREIVTDQEGLEVVKLALRLFLLWASKIIGKTAPARSKSSQTLYPWAQALCISPDLSVNASAQLSVDTKAATVFLTINAGVFVQLAHRTLAMFADEKFILNVEISPEYSSRETVEREPCDGSWCTLKPANINFRLIAAWITAFAAMIVLNHELAHFHRGHLAYLKTHKDKLKLLEVYDSSRQQEPEEDDLLRLLEFDADAMGGNLYGVIMREFDHPVPGPEDGKNERFLILTIAAAASMFIIFEEKMASRRYYPPAWRLQQFFDAFISSFFAQPISADVRDFCSKLLFSTMNHIDARYAALNWGNGFDMEAAAAHTDMLICKDLPGLAELADELKKFMPHLWPKERKHNR